MSKRSNMSSSEDQFLANADLLRELHSRIHETCEHRARSAAEHAEWKAACAEFHERFDDLFFPGGEAGWSAFLAGTPEGTRLATLFLEVDPCTFRSGYHKQVAWDRLKGRFLTEEERRRLEGAGLAYLHRRVRRDFWHMASFVRLRGSTTFWQRVETLAPGAENQPAAMKARWLLLTRMNRPVRQWIGSELLRAKYEPGYLPRLDFPVPGFTCA